MSSPEGIVTRTYPWAPQASQRSAAVSSVTGFAVVASFIKVLTPACNHFCAKKGIGEPSLSLTA